MTIKRPLKLNKSVVMRYGTSQSIDREIYSALSDYANIKNSIYWKKKELENLQNQIARLESEIGAMLIQKSKAFDTLDELFSSKRWNAPDFEALCHAMDEIVQFRKKHAPIDDNGNIILEDVEEESK